MYVLLGEFDQSLKTAFDFDYWLRLFKAMPARVGFTDAVQAYSRLHEQCITRRERRTIALEGLRVLRRHLQQAPPHWAITHIGEILQGSPPAQATPEQRALVAEFLLQAAEFLTEAHYERLAREWN
jgi:hypothetical protein